MQFYKLQHQQITYSKTLVHKQLVHLRLSIFHKPPAIQSLKKPDDFSLKFTLFAESIRVISKPKMRLNADSYFSPREQDRSKTSVLMVMNLC